MTHPVAVFDLTIKAEGLAVEDVKKGFRELFKKWTFQLEEGHDTGFLHYQGRGSLYKKLRVGQAVALVHKLFPSAHVSPTSSEVATLGDAFYVTKLDTRVLGPWDDREREKFTPYQYEGMEATLLPWQKVVWDSADVREPRIVNCVYDPVGENGKSTIAMLMDLHGRGLDVPPVNDSKELVATVCDILTSKEERDPKCIFVDMPRAMDKSKLHGIYGAIEQIKKGKVYDLRYKYREWWFHAPQVWVFTNIEPDLSLLSRDRWRVWTIVDKQIVAYPGISRVVPVVPVT